MALCRDVLANEYNARRGGGDGYLGLARRNHVGLGHWCDLPPPSWQGKTGNYSLPFLSMCSVSIQLSVCMCVCVWVSTQGCTVLSVPTIAALQQIPLKQRTISQQPLPRVFHFSSVHCDDGSPSFRSQCALFNPDFPFNSQMAFFFSLMVCTMFLFFFICLWLSHNHDHCVVVLSVTKSIDSLMYLLTLCTFSGTLHVPIDDDIHTISVEFSLPSSGEHENVALPLLIPGSLLLLLYYNLIY